ncbi:MAG: cell division protein ZapE [Alphaproteobacteria bacterium]|nr:cell division protein ZapE [Alphaproteobacteria bacterium]
MKPNAYYQARLDAGEITHDAAQTKIMNALHDLALRMPRLAREPFLPRWLRWLARREKNRGLYIYGTVGRGKTMMMDMFFESVHGIAKRRVHFHAFMLDVHSRLHAKRQDPSQAVRDNAVVHVAIDLAKEAKLLCFDEFQVHNIADAMILSRFFRELFRRGVVVVATSNTAPDNLYAGGLQRVLFLPFIDLIKKHLHVLYLDDGCDYRQDRIKGLPVYLSPIDERAVQGLSEFFSKLTDGDEALPTDIVVEQGRELHVSRAAHGVAWFTFEELCRDAKGTPDYLALAKNFHTIILEGVPQLNDIEKNSTLRFIHLIDVLYDNHVRIALSAEKPLKELLDATSAYRTQFERTESRLMEMQSQDYLLAPSSSIKQ